VIWASLPDRHEGGSPNVVGAIALAAACTALARIGMDKVARQEIRLGDLLRTTLERVPGLISYTTWAGPCDRVGVVAFNLRGRDHAEVAAILSGEHGIGVRNGSFCAHPLLVHLAGGGPDGWRPGCGLRVPGAVRASLGLGTGAEELRRLGNALCEIAERGPRWKYRTAPDGSVWPVPDDRSRPRLPLVPGCPR
ncbi:MAG TPA: aminotransferase class V-fold PLP-dependent enzyme, partial [Candidatus Saccharimonadales bacterium]|nr:aminotransferase class V-fold PLP-dependent enzyme [Candidatus Saccharimonadales bacterium]